jgi:hypothetical protein
MSDARGEQERPCLHCMLVDVIDEFFAEYPAAAGGSDKVDTGEADEVIDAIAKTVAELTSQRRHYPAAIDRTVDAPDHEFRRVSCTALTAASRAFSLPSSAKRLQVQSGLMHGINRRVEGFQPTVERVAKLRYAA